MSKMKWYDVPPGPNLFTALWLTVVICGVGLPAPWFVVVPLVAGVVGFLGEWWRYRDHGPPL